jgi:hypothetical protein
MRYYVDTMVVIMLGAIIVATTTLATTRDPTRNDHRSSECEGHYHRKAENIVIMIATRVSGE